MYKQAAEINPNSALVRAGRFDLSLLWVGSFHADIELLDQTLDSITGTLYRGLTTADADADQTSTILAHVGYLQVIHKFNRLPFLIRPRRVKTLPRRCTFSKSGCQQIPNP